MPQHYSSRIFALFMLISSGLIPGCDSTPQDILTELLNKRGGIVSEVTKQAAKFRLQILYSQIDRDSANNPHIHTFHFRTDEFEYFYPASTVKFPAAVLALEKLNNLAIPALDRTTAMFTDSASDRQTRVVQDSSSQSGLPSVGHYVKKIFLVSDNDAFNRLYEFLGQSYFNRRLKELGFSDVRMTHRLSVFLTEEQNRNTNPVRFLSDGQLLYEQAAQFNKDDLGIPGPIPVGIGFMQGETYIAEPMDFSVKNCFPLKDQQQFLINVIFPNTVMGNLKINLRESDYQFLYQYMSQLPRETLWPPYDTTEYYDGYAKFFIYGNSRERIPEHIRIFNKIGMAYGFLTDNAYIIDLKNNIEFLLAATLYVNENQTLNDNTYEYDQIGLPFLADLGKMIYEYELTRKRANEPDLSRFRLQYDH